MMDKEYCIEPEMPYCPACEFGYVDTSNCETYEDMCEYAPWVCLCTKEKYDEYMRNHKGEQNDKEKGNRVD